MAEGRLPGEDKDSERERKYERGEKNKRETRIPESLAYITYTKQATSHARSRFDLHPGDLGSNSELFQSAVCIYCRSVTTPSYSRDLMYSRVRSKWRLGPSRLGFGSSSLV
jgi:hypothetical protein